MRKIGWILGFVLLSSSVFGRSCPNNDYKACAKVLDDTNRAHQGKPFIEAFDDICKTNSKFRCVKVTVMGEPNQAIKDVREEHPKAKLYFADQEDGKSIYIFEKK